MSIQSIRKVTNSKYILLLQYLFIILWGTQLLNSDSYYVNYILILLTTSICSYCNYKDNKSLVKKIQEKRVVWTINIFSVLFSLMIALANYKIWTAINGSNEFGSIFKILYDSFFFIVFLFGGFFAFKNIFSFIFNNLKKIIWKKNETFISSKKIYIISFLILVITRCIIFIFCQYPGIVTPDSVWQIRQVMTGIYSNHHPFYHTMIIKFFITLGNYLFNSLYAGIALYSIFQILFTSCCFSYAVSTIVKMKVPKWIVVSTLMFFVLMPYHIMYAITMWKDIYFSCFVLLFTIAFYRCLQNYGNNYLNKVILAISSIGICIFRSNGFFAFVILFISFIIIWKLKYKSILIIFIVTLSTSLVMNKVVIKQLNVTQPDTIESLSIPAQQIARVVKDGHSLEIWQRRLLSNIIDINEIPNSYLSYTSDPIKDLVRQRGKQELIIIINKAEYIKLYLSLGIKYPTSYFKAWIDETRGFWNAGYEIRRWAFGVSVNEFNIHSITRSKSVDRILRNYLWLYTDVHLLRLLLSIGLFVWINLFILMITIFRKDKLGLFLSLPNLVIVISLLVATPVFAEFRYLYSIFCTLPLIVVVGLRPINKEVNL